MATRSNIGILNKDGTVLLSYSHWDGYPSEKGKMLLTHYTCQDKIVRLVSLGASSVLYRNIDPVGKHTYDKPEKDVTIFYTRDRGEPWFNCSPRTFENAEEARNNMEEYMYLWDGDRWLYSDHKSPLQELTMEICEKD